MKTIKYKTLVCRDLDIEILKKTFDTKMPCNHVRVRGKLGQHETCKVCSMVCTYYRLQRIKNAHRN